MKKTNPTLLSIMVHVKFAGRYHDGYSEGGYSQYDATSFQTVPGSASGNGGGGGGGNVGTNEQWGVGGPLGEHLSHHPAFLAGLGPRESANSHHPSSLGNNPDQKPLLQSAMLAGYTGACSYIFLKMESKLFSFIPSFIHLHFQQA